MSAKLYLSGPMSGYKDYNRPLFMAATKCLRDKGYTILNPCESDGEVPSNATWRDYLKKDLRMLADADGIIVLPRWEDSKGARLEVHICFQLGLPVFRFDMRKKDIVPFMRRSDRDGITKEDKEVSP